MITGHITRDIKCGACGYEGKVEAHDTVNIVPETNIFRNLGKDSSTGFLHFRCPSCDKDLAVDPLKVLWAKQMAGYPDSYTTSGKAQQMTWGAVIYLSAALFIFIKFSGWWTYIVSGILLTLAIRVGLFSVENMDHSQKDLKIGFLKKIMNKAKGIDPFFEDIRTEQIDLYQHYFNKVIRSVDIDTETNWSMSKSCDKERFRQDEAIMEKIIVGEAGSEDLSPAILQVIVHQYFFADVHQREMDKNCWVKKVMYRKDVDYFPSGWQVKKLLDTVSNEL